MTRHLLKLDKRLVLSFLLLIGIAAVFWFGSRYPSLNEKALMGVDSPVSGLAFDTIVSVLPESNLIWQLTGNFINWIYTNLRGMTFGILFGAALLTVLPMLQSLSFRSRSANAFLGMLIGAPMGVCVNCVAPIAKGMHLSGTRFETTIAALIASPTLNVIVLSMTFALLPFYMAMTKLALTIALILLIVPVLGRIWKVPPVEPDLIEAKRPKADRTGWMNYLTWWHYAPPPMGEGRLGWFAAINWVSSSFLRGFRFLFLTTVPLMLIAGFAGAALITFLPIENVVHQFEGIFGGIAAGLVGMLLLALFAVFLPVPIAFDVIFVAILLSAGLSAKFATVLLIALGSYSLVAFLVVGQIMRYRVALGLAVVVVLVSISGGVIGFLGEKRSDARLKLAILEKIGEVPAPRQGEGVVVPAFSREQINAQAAPPVRYRTLENITVTHDGPAQITVKAASVGTPKSSAAGKPFRALPGPEIGLGQVGVFSDLDVLNVVSELHSISAGDINGDGWIDLVVNDAPEEGQLHLYRNIGGRFMRQAIDLGPLSSALIAKTALVDLNGDQQLDLYLSTMESGAVILLNEAGTFAYDRRIDLPRMPTGFAKAVGFADLDGDGDLDILHGNYVGGAVIGQRRKVGFTLEGGRDAILWNEGATFTEQVLDGLPGVTLTTMIMDLTADGLPDILIGDDFTPTDKVYVNKGARTFEMATRSAPVMANTLNTTMSYDWGDLNNDLRPEVYGVQISKPRIRPPRRALDLCRQLKNRGTPVGGALATCARWIDSIAMSHRNSGRGKERECLGGDKSAQTGMCRVFSVLRYSYQTGDTQYCKAIPKPWSVARKVCLLADGESASERQFVDFVKRNVSAGPVQENLLASQTSDGDFETLPMADSVKRPGWGWNGRFVDLDQDGLQDIFLNVGVVGNRFYDSNAFLKNLGENVLENRAAQFGLDDFVPSDVSVFIDFDRDGDVDVVRIPMLGPMVVDVSDGASGAGFWVSLRDNGANSFGIGATVVIETVNGKQRRDIKASGGYGSHDAPVAHFGLGEAADVLTIKITWPNSEQTTINGPFEAGHDVIVEKSG